MSLNVLTNLHFKSSADSLRLHLIPPQAESIKALIAKNALIGVKIDIFLWYAPEVNELPFDFDELTIPTVALFSDWNLNYVQTIAALERFDLVLLDKKGVQVAQKLGFSNVLEYNQYALHTHEYSFSSLNDNSVDVAFVGNIVPWVQKNRGSWIRRLLLLGDQINIRVETKLYGDDFKRLLSSAKVVFNHSIRGEANMRVFETLNCGGLVFIEDSNVEIDDYLDSNACYKYSDKDMEKQLLELVADHDRCAKIKMSAQQQKQAWSSESRWKELARILICEVAYGKRKINKDYTVSTLQLRLVAPVKFHGNNPVEIELQSTLKDSMTPSQISTALSFLYVNKIIQKDILELAKSLYSAVKYHKKGLVWNTFHYAGILERLVKENRTLDSRLYLQEEFNLWKDFLERNDLADSDIYRGYFAYPLPYPKHSELQAATWNQWVPNTFIDEPNLMVYMQYLACHRAGEICIESNDVFMSKNYFQRAIGLYAGNAQTWEIWASLNRHNTDICTTALEASYEIDPMNCQVALALLDCYVSAKQWRNAKMLYHEIDSLFELQVKAYAVSVEVVDSMKSYLNMIRPLLDKVSND